VVGRHDHQVFHVAAEEGDLLRRELAPIHSGECGALEERVVDVGHVLGVAHVEIAVEPQAHEGVVGEVGIGVPEMRGVVRGDSADIETGGHTGSRVGESASCRVEQSGKRSAPR